MANKYSQKGVKVIKGRVKIIIIIHVAVMTKGHINYKSVVS